MHAYTGNYAGQVRLTAGYGYDAAAPGQVNQDVMERRAWLCRITRQGGVRQKPANTGLVRSDKRPCTYTQAHARRHAHAICLQANSHHARP
eukprot:352856-Chlamydomonas_euryale.AAC.8